MSDKPTHVKPSFYAFLYEEAKEIAKNFGYNLVLHGSMNRDLDLIAIPWIDDPEPELNLVEALDNFVNEVPHTYVPHSPGRYEYMHSVLPGGRNSYVININRGGSWNYYQDKQYYLDISFTPFKKL